jgi:hypothetical protein
MNETIKKVLSGNCAIQVNNAREFKLLMEHCKSNGWTSIIGDRAHEITFDYCFKDKRTVKAISYGGKFCFPHNYTDEINAEHEYLILANYKVIPFADFASEIGIDVPVFVMTSEDGFDLYVGDGYFRIANIENVWELSTGVYFMTTNDVNRKYPFKNLLFSTKEAAEAWISKANKPKELNVNLFGGGKAIVTSKSIVLEYPDSDKIQLKPSDLEDMLHAMQSLQELPK